MIKLAFYKAKKGNWLDWCIGFWTRPKFFNFFDLGYSHVEMVFDNEICCSSSPRDGGVRWKKIEGINNSDKWDIVDFNFDSTNPYSEANIILHCNREMGKKYDWICFIFTQFIPFDIQHQSKWICSEFCGVILFNLKQAHRYNPNKFYKLVTK